MNAEAGTRFVLCADDYALSENINTAMLDLIDAGRLSAVSAMATGLLWAETARDLAIRRGTVSIGLHLDLTSRPFSGKRPPYVLRDLILAALTGQLDLKLLTAEFARQLALFEQVLGHPPDHVDGHHHVHALPGVRDALFQVLGDRFRATPKAARPWIRNPGDAWVRIAVRPGARVKALAAAVLTTGIGERAAREGFLTNEGFGGFSRFRGAETYAREFRYFTRAPGARHLVMCHPGKIGPGAEHEIASARASEYAFLAAESGLPSRLHRITRSSEGDMHFPA